MCGAPLAFAYAGNGIIILDLNAKVYAIVYDKTDTRKIEVVRTSMAFPEHTCTHEHGEIANPLDHCSK